MNRNSLEVSTQVNALDMLLYLQNHYNTASLESTAKYFDFHPNYLSAVFKKMTGKRFIDYLHQIRLQKANILLKSTDLAVEQIAGAVGYSNVSFFYRIFKEKYGMTPSQYRKFKDMME